MEEKNATHCKSLFVPLIFGTSLAIAITILLDRMIIDWQDEIGITI